MLRVDSNLIPTTQLAHREKKICDDAHHECRMSCCTVGGEWEPFTACLATEPPCCSGLPVHASRGLRLHCPRSDQPPPACRPKPHHERTWQQPCPCLGCGPARWRHRRRHDGHSCRAEGGALPPMVDLLRCAPTSCRQRCQLAGSRQQALHCWQPVGEACQPTAAPYAPAARQADFAASARLQMEAVGADKEATRKAGQDILKEASCGCIGRQLEQREEGHRPALLRVPARLPGPRTVPPHPPACLPSPRLHRASQA